MANKDLFTRRGGMAFVGIGHQSGRLTVISPAEKRGANRFGWTGAELLSPIRRKQEAICE